jgi:hypothetical protein
MLETSGVIYDMYAMAGDGLCTVNVVLENLTIMQTLAITEKEYMEASVGQLPAALQSMGVGDVTAELTEITFAGQPHAAIKVHGTIQGVDLYETLVCVKQGTYIACITSVSYMEDTTESVLAWFVPAAQ